MGYYTNYTLTWTTELSEFVVKDCPECGQSVKEPVNNAVYQHYIKNSDNSYHIPWCQLFEDATKWYDWHTDMTKLSKTFPTVTFTLKGEGEEAGDVWVAYFLNGKSIRHQLSIDLPEFNKEDLK
jgi:hypothetical protein